MAIIYLEKFLNEGASVLLDSTQYTKILSAADDNVAKAMITLDQHEHMTNFKTISDPVYNGLVTDENINCDCAANDITINLPSVGITQGKEIIVRKIDDSLNVIIVQVNGGKTINYSLTLTISSQFSSASLKFDGTNWIIN